MAALKVGLLFLVISSPMTYKLVDGLVGSVARAVVPGAASAFRVAENGCPTTYGLVVHAGVFVLAVYYLSKH
jgi:hypothetical protein